VSPPELRGGGARAAAARLSSGGGGGGGDGGEDAPSASTATSVPPIEGENVARVTELIGAVAAQFNARTDGARLPTQLVELMEATFGCLHDPGSTALLWLQMRVTEAAASTAAAADAASAAGGWVIAVDQDSDQLVSVYRQTSPEGLRVSGVAGVAHARVFLASPA
jgi:hypothetical protein